MAWKASLDNQAENIKKKGIEFLVSFKTAKIWWAVGTKKIQVFAAIAWSNSVINYNKIIYPIFKFHIQYSKTEWYFSFRFFLALWLFLLWIQGKTKDIKNKYKKQVVLSLTEL